MPTIKPATVSAVNSMIIFFNLNFFPDLKYDYLDSYMY